MSVDVLADYLERKIRESEPGLFVPVGRDKALKMLKRLRGETDPPEKIGEVFGMPIVVDPDMEGVSLRFGNLSEYIVPVPLVIEEGEDDGSP